MKPWKIALAEPHVLIREALRQLLADDKDIAVVGEAADAAGVRAIATKLTPDVLFLNASLLGAKLSIADILDENPGTSIVILTENREEEDLVDYLRAGAKGILTKEEIAAPLVKALKAAATGTLWAPRKVMGGLVDDLRAHATARIDRFSPSLNGLTARERTIATMIGQGQTNKQIARFLRLSEKTVRNHLTAIFRKLGCRNRTQLAAAVQYNKNA